MKLDKNVKGGLGRRDAFRKRYGGNYEGGREAPKPTLPPMSAAAQAVLDQVERIKTRQEAAE